MNSIENRVERIEKVLGELIVEVGQIKKELKAEPKCSKCGTAPKLELTNRKTGAKYFYSLCRRCESARQVVGRKRKAVRDQLVGEVFDTQLANVLTRDGLDTIREVEAYAKQVGLQTVYGIAEANEFIIEYTISSLLEKCG